MRRLGTIAVLGACCVVGIERQTNAPALLQRAAVERAVPLMRAARRGDVDKARALLRAGADVNEAGSGGGTALMSAAHDPDR